VAELATDNFNRANADDLGSNWTGVTGLDRFHILSNAAERILGEDSADFYNGVSWPNDQYSQVVIKTVGPDVEGFGAGPMVRAASGAMTLYFAVPHTGECELFKIVSGSWTLLAQGGTAPSVDDVLYLEAQGTALKTKLNGSDELSTTDSDISSGNAGIYGGANGEASTADDWAGGDFVAGGGATPFGYRPLLLQGVGA